MTVQEFKQNWMKDYEVVFGEDEQVEQVSEFSEMLDNAFLDKFKEGEVYKGKILNVGSDFVLVDIGYKQEGLISVKEFLNFDGSVKIAAGDVSEVYLEKFESNSGELVLSKEKAEILNAWDKISEACENGESVKGTVLAKVKGGLAVDIGVKAFLPGSQIDIKPTRNLDKFLGEELEFKVIKFNKKRGNIVLSRRAILQEERGKLRSEILSQIQEGMVVKGVVKNITDYGAFLDLGGIDGLLHITDMSWGRVKHPSHILKIGEELEVKILKYDSEKERVSLGLKQVQENPWDTAIDIYVPGMKVKGEIVSLKDYGAFVELADGIEGLVHVSEMSWSGKNQNPSRLFTIGEQIDALVLEVDIDSKRISLGVKQLSDNPWDIIYAKYPVGTKVKGKVASIADFGAFIDFGEEVDGLIHISDFSWNKKNIQISEELKIGDEVESVILKVDPEAQKLSLGIKQLTDDPWKILSERLTIGTVTEVEVVRVTDFGAFVELEKGIEGLIHISELSEERVEKPEDFVKKGDKLKAMVISFDLEAKKIALSAKSAINAEASDMSDYSKENSNIATLGDQLKNFKV